MYNNYNYIYLDNDDNNDSKLAKIYFSSTKQKLVFFFLSLFFSWKSDFLREKGICSAGW